MNEFFEFKNSGGGSGNGDYMGCLSSILTAIFIFVVVCIVALFTE